MRACPCVGRRRHRARRPDMAAGAALAAEIKDLGRKAVCVRMDMTKLAEIREGVREAHRHFSRIDILVNNAGIGAPNPAEKMTEKDFDDTVAVNLKGPFFVSQAVGTLMMERSLAASGTSTAEP